MAITVRPADLVASISFLGEAEGGRQSAAASGYRANHDFGLPGTLNGAAHEYIGQNSLAPGKTTRANIWLLAPELQEGRLYAGFRFSVQEGLRIVGYGVIEEVVSANLRRVA